MVEHPEGAKMKGKQTVEVAIVAGLMILWGAADAYAFHAGGSAGCEGCHTMHNSQGGKGSNGTTQFQAGIYLLQGSDQSSVCLNCHQGGGLSGPLEYHVSTAPEDMPQGSPPKQLSPGGDFGWLKKSYTWTDTIFGPRSSPGDHHGHNIIAADYNYAADKNLQSAPGGTYPSANLHCTSCHDPHGKYRRNADGSITTSGLPIIASGSYGNSPDPTSTGAVGVYRMLAGVNYQPRSLSGSFPFVNSPPRRLPRPITIVRRARFRPGSLTEKGCPSGAPIAMRACIGTASHRASRVLPILQATTQSWEQGLHPITKRM